MIPCGRRCEIRSVGAAFLGLPHSNAANYHDTENGTMNGIDDIVIRL